MKVAIAGAGPAGACTALLLARAGIEVTLVERESSFERVFRGEGLMPSGVDALLQMGLGDVLAGVPGRLARSWNIYMDGEEVFAIPEPVATLGERAMRIVSQPALLAGIVERAARYPTFHFQPGTRVTGLLRDSVDRVSGLRLETPDGRRDLPADLVVACDGRGSTLRSLAGLHLELLPEGYDVVWFKVPAPADMREGGAMMIMVAAGEDPAICYTSWDERLQYGLIVAKGSARRLAAEEDWLASALAPAPPWLAAHIHAQRPAIEGPLRLSVVVGRCATWTTPGLLLLGDAAHPMSPVRAQGINLACRDAIVAANHLVPALRGDGGPAALDAAARAIQAARQPEVVRAQSLQLREAQGQVEARGATWRYALARRLAPVLGRYGWAKRAWLRRQHDLRFGVTEVRLDAGLAA